MAKIKNSNDPDSLLKRAYSLADSDQTRELYRDWAATYDDTMLGNLEYLTPQRTAELLANSISEKNAKILDVGSGTGLAGFFLAGFGFSNIDALDFSPEMLRVASEKKMSGTSVYDGLIEADLNRSLDLSSNSYDALICTGTFTHAHVGSECLSELFRILKPGGMFACTIHLEVWEPAGFAREVERLSNAGMFMTKEMTKGKYFATDNAPQGWFILWEKTG